jgi:hypothetical protein
MESDGLKACAEKPRGEIGQALGNQDKLLTEISATITKLAERISPILSGGPDSLPKDEPTNPIGAKLAIGINKNNEFLLESLMRLNKMIDSVEL